MPEQQRVAASYRGFFADGVEIKDSFFVATRSDLKWLRDLALLYGYRFELAVTNPAIARAALGRPAPQHIEREP